MNKKFMWKWVFLSAINVIGDSEAKIVSMDILGVQIATYKFVANV